jgi:DNA-binding beta-propeller fold protein YncE
MDAQTVTKTRNSRETLLAALVFLLIGIVPTSIRAHTGSGIGVDRRGQVYFVDTGSGLWKIDARGKLSHLSRLRPHWLAIDEDNRFASTRLPTGPLGDISKVGSNPTILLSTDWPIAIGRDGNLYYQSGPSGHLQLMRMLPSGATSAVATLPNTSAGPLPHINGITAGPGESLYYTENNAIRRITAEGIIGTVVTVPALVDGPSIPGTDVHPYLRGLAVDPNGVMYVADNGDARVLRITAEGNITTLVQTQSPWAPTAVALFGSDVYVLEFLHTARDVRRDWLPRVRKIKSNGTSTIIMTVDRMPGAR